MTITNNIAAKLVVAFVAVAMSFTVFASSANAAQYDDMSTDELIALIQQLLGQSSSSTGSCDYTFTVPMGMGASGADVMNLQKFLNMDAETRVAASGVGSAGMETQYYGALTAAAVSKFQTKYMSEVLTPLGLVQPTGYFGNSSITKANAICADGGSGSGSGSGSMSGDLEGGAGSISDTDLVSKLSNEEVGEGEDDVEVAGLEIEADEGSDIELRAVTLDFDKGSANRDFDKYATEIAVWFDGEEVARMDADEFDDDNNYQKTITLDGGAIIRADDKGELVVTVSGISNLDSNDEGETWTVDFETVRFMDGLGSTISETITEDPVTFSFEPFATASDLEFKVSKGDKDINDARSIEVSSTTETDNVEILSFEIEVEGDSDVTVKDLQVNFATSTGDTLTDLINTAELVVDGDVIGSETITSAYNDDGVVVFDDLDWDIDAGDTVEVIVRVDMNELNTGTFGAGATLSASVNPDNAGWDVEDEEGETVENSDKSGSATSDAHSFYGDGINVKLVSVSDTSVAGDGNDDDYVKLTIKFDVTAYGEKVYVDKTVTKTGATNAGTAYGVDLSDAEGSYVAAASSSAAFSSTADSGTNGYEVDEGDTETFTLTVTVQNAATSTFDAKYVRAVLTSLGFNTDDSTTWTNYTSGLTDDFKTDFAYISN